MHASAGRLVLLAVAVGSLILRRAVAGGEPAPYVVTAIDYHFHDAHPTFPIGLGRDLVVKNQGRNLHNVTIPALGYSRDVAAGRSAHDRARSPIGSRRVATNCSAGSICERSG